ncbi:hypothetical protein BH20ACT11_BH20ACT11_07820 [soil metagenome]|jgi:hypothetical protein
MAASLHYRILVYEFDADTQTQSVIMDAEGEAFQAAVGAEHEGRMRGERIVGGPVDLCAILADLIADNPLDLPR